MSNVLRDATRNARILIGADDDPIEPSDAPPPPPIDKGDVEESFWEPDLNPTQRKIFDDPTKFILGHGEKGSGKTIGFGHKMIRHAYENDNALVIIITNTIRAGHEGIWHDLDTLILPAWREGMQLEYTQSKLDPLTKDRHRWVRNRFGGWSKLMLMSVVYGSQVEARVKGPAPSYVHIEEITNCDTRDYFKWPAAQIGRRPGISGPQQLTASCNPDGPNHWAYKVFFVECINEKQERSPNFAVYHVPIHENKHRLPEGYVEGLADIFDEIERRRLIKGEWIDRPTGDGLFSDFYKPAIHVKGDAVSGRGLVPDPRFLSVVSYDIGPMWPSITFEQMVRVKGKMVWIIYDEIDKHGVKTIYKNLAREVISRMMYWNRLAAKEHGRKIDFMHVTDESAINQWRAGGEGSYDAWEFEKEYAKAATELEGDESAKALRQLRLIGCPKGAGSIEARVRLLQSKLFLEELFVSATCQNSKDMLAQIKGDEHGKPTRSKYVHKFDSMTYGMFKMEMSETRNSLPSRQVAPTLIHCGTE